MIIDIMIDKGFQNICYCHRMSKIFNPIPQLWSGQSLKWDIHFDNFCSIFVQTLDTPEVFNLQYQHEILRYFEAILLMLALHKNYTKKNKSENLGGISWVLVFLVTNVVVIN